MNAGLLHCHIEPYNQGLFVIHTYDEMVGSIIVVIVNTLLITQ